MTTWRPVAGHLLTQVALATLATVVAGMPALQRIEVNLRDALNVRTSPVAEYSDILVFDIEEASLAALHSQLGAWPYERDIYALVNDFLHEQGAHSVTYDILFSEPRAAAGDQALAESLSRFPRTLLASILSDGQAVDSAADSDRFAPIAWPVEPPRSDQTATRSLVLPIERFRPLARIGVISVRPDADGYLRRMPLTVAVRDREVPTLALATLGVADPAPKLRFHSDTAEYQSHHWPVTAERDVLLRLPRNIEALPTLPFYQLVLAAIGSPEYAHLGDQISGRSVFVGSSAAILGDYVYVPGHGRMAGLAVLAATYHSLAHGALVRPSRTWLNVVLLAACMLPVMLFGYGRWPTLPRVFGLTALGLTLSLALPYTLLATLTWQTWVVPPLIAVLAQLLLIVATRYRGVVRERLQLRREADAARLLAEHKGRFLAMMTHELRTPLNAIIGYNQLRIDGEIAESEQRANAEIIDRNAQHLLALINNLLDQSKIEAGQLELNPVPVDVREELNATLALLDSIARQKSLSLSCAVDSGVPQRVEIDPLRMRQVVINLIGNALKFTRKGGVDVRVAWANDGLRIAVQDTGPGIPEAAQRRIFEAFQQSDPSVAAEHGGTGLGLAISQNLARLMGGEISVYSETGAGSTFTFRARAPRAAAKRQSRAVGQLSGTVLLADDNPDNRALIGLYLRKMGLAVIQAESGSEAVHQATALKPDLILMDIEMPDMTGLEATDILRSAGHREPIVALTAHEDPVEHRRARAAGCVDVLVKPITQERLGAAIARYLARS